MAVEEQVDETEVRVDPGGIRIVGADGEVIEPDGYAAKVSGTTSIPADKVPPQKALLRGTWEGKAEGLSFKPEKGVLEIGVGLRLTSIERVPPPPSLFDEEDAGHGTSILTVVTAGCDSCAWWWTGSDPEEAELAAKQHREEHLREDEGR